MRFGPILARDFYTREASRKARTQWRRSLQNIENSAHVAELSLGAFSARHYSVWSRSIPDLRGRCAGVDRHRGRGNIPARPVMTVDPVEALRPE
jgi:hypothetical protein